MISNILPEGILTIILVIVLFYLTYDSFEKAIGLWKKETVAMEKEALAYKPLPGNSTELANIQSTTLSNNSGDLLGPKQSLNRDSA
jgi:predicted DNA repair protein MutK